MEEMIMIISPDKFGSEQDVNEAFKKGWSMTAMLEVGGKAIIHFEKPKPKEQVGYHDRPISDLGLPIRK